jgi:hypothetical protein
MVFFVGGQLMLIAAVASASRTRGGEETMRLIARRFGTGSIAALAVVVATPSSSGPLSERVRKAGPRR